MTVVLCLVASMLAPCSPASPVPATVPPSSREVVVAAPARWHGVGQPAIEDLVPAVPLVDGSTPPEPEPTAPVTLEPLSLRERTLGKLAELGAPAWVIGAFDCLGRWESGWQNVRSNTADTGVLQINDVHRPELNRLGLDPWSPEDSAVFAWRLFTRAGWSFRDWVAAPKCGLR